MNDTADAEKIAAERKDYQAANYLLARHQFNIGCPINIGLMFFGALAAAGVIIQSILINHTFQVARHEYAPQNRASIYLGTPNGEIGEFAFDGKDTKLMLHFKNYGRDVAKHALVELWPAINRPDQPAIVQEIPPFGENKLGLRPATVDVPPGFPYEALESIKAEDRVAIESGQASIEVLGRLSYSDSFGRYCEAFGVTYLQKPFKRFILGAPPQKDYCGSKAQIAMYWGTRIGTKPVQVVPPRSLGPIIKLPSLSTHLP